MNTTQVLSTPEMATAIAEGIQKGFVDALSQGYREPRECNPAGREGSHHRFLGRLLGRRRPGCAQAGWRAPPVVVSQTSASIEEAGVSRQHRTIGPGLLSLSRNC
jgi:hypothetical protein